MKFLIVEPSPFYLKYHKFFETDLLCDWLNIKMEKVPTFKYYWLVATIRRYRWHQWRLNGIARSATDCCPIESIQIMKEASRLKAWQSIPEESVAVTGSSRGTLLLCETRQTSCLAFQTLNFVVWNTVDTRDLSRSLSVRILTIRHM